MGGLANYLLVRWSGGYVLVEDAASQTAHGVKQALLTLSNITDEDEATRIGQATLGFSASPRVAAAAGIEPTGAGDSPFTDWDLGDTLVAPDETGATSAQRVVSITVAEDDNGDATFAPELRDTLTVQEERLNRWMKRLINGSLRGQSNSAAPPTSPPETGFSVAST